MGARAIWSGAISFGPLHVPVKMYSAAEEREDIAFRQVHRRDGGRIQLRRVCSHDGEEVPYADIAKALEWGDQLVVLTDEELVSLPVPTLRQVSVRYFCDPDEVDPMLYEKPYYLAPDKGAERAYELLRRAMSGQAGIGRVTIRNRERTVMLLSRPEGIVMLTLRYAEDIRPFPVIESPEVSTEEMVLALKLVHGMSGTFDPAEFTDSWAAAVRKLGEDKVNGVKLVPKADEPVAAALSLIDSLTAAVAAIKAEKD